MCEHLPMYTVSSPDENFPWGVKHRVQSSSSHFHFDDAVCFVKPPRVEEAEEELWHENQRTLVED